MKGILLGLALILLFSLAGCREMVNFQPDPAVIKDISESTMGGSFLVDAPTIQIVQKQVIKEHTFYLVSYQGFDRSLNSKMECQTIRDVFKNRLQTWTVGGGGGSCHPIEQKDHQPFEIGSGRSSGQAPFTFDLSSVSGFINDPQIKTIEVTWEDGQTQRVAAAASGYMVIREGFFNLKQVSGLDEAGKIIHSQAMP